jgi:hypothetical protein
MYSRRVDLNPLVSNFYRKVQTSDHKVDINKLNENDKLNNVIKFHESMWLATFPKMPIDSHSLPSDEINNYQ